ncbi:MAG TPA: hypothetical protein DDY18_08985 [Flavobacterium sp.]|jgi:primosomal protein N'|nr:hypothetical protein [Flavobacterium sp.]
MKKKPKDNSVVIENQQLKAIESVLSNTYEYFERKVRRWFSKEYSTPYLDTFKMSWPELLLHYYEAGFEKLEYNEIYDMAVKEYLPEFIQKADEEDQAFADSLLEEQQATIAKKKAKDGSKDPLQESLGKMVNSASNVVQKAQSLKKTLDKRKTTLPKPKAMSLKFEDEGDPENF